MKKQSKKLNLKTDKIITLSSSQMVNLKGGTGYDLAVLRSKR
jgi:hypothetical protein